jgi:hypothetical protein
MWIDGGYVLGAQRARQCVGECACAAADVERPFAGADRGETHHLWREGRAVASEVAFIGIGGGAEVWRSHPSPSLRPARAGLGLAARGSCALITSLLACRGAQAPH